MEVWKINKVERKETIFRILFKAKEVARHWKDGMKGFRVSSNTRAL